MPAKHQALVEYLRLADAERLIAYHHSGPGVNIKGSNLLKPVPHRPEQEPYLSIGPQNCLLLTIYNMKMEFNCTDVRQICSPTPSLSAASSLNSRRRPRKPFLNGANMYTNCNAIRCDYARANAFEYFMSRRRCWRSTGPRGRRPGHAIGGVVGRPGQLGGAGVGAAGGAANQELLAQSAMSLVSRVAAAAAAANPAAAGGFAAPYGHPQAGQKSLWRASPWLRCATPAPPSRRCRHLNGQRVLGSIVRVSLSDQDNVKRNTKDFTLPDGTLAEKSYDSLKFNRFMTPESAAKNQASLGKIGPVLYFWGCPDGSDEETVRDALKEAGAPARWRLPCRPRSAPRAGSPSRRRRTPTDAICLANHSIVGESARLKLTYAVNKKDGSGQAFQRQVSCCSVDSLCNFAIITWL
uniref:Gelsolin-like domain-containing protein n=1 Tax=Macrostomum lignano TaxID=282301 RepID=A0A1I8F3R8_9PLAT